MLWMVITKAKKKLQIISILIDWIDSTWLFLDIFISSKHSILLFIKTSDEKNHQDVYLWANQNISTQQL